MKMFENTLSTDGSLSEGNNSEIKRVSRDTMIALLKLVYFEKKTIKQAANFLKVDYNTAKRILRKFKRNTLNLNEFEGKFSKLARDLAPKSKSVSQISLTANIETKNKLEVNEDVKDVNLFNTVFNEIKNLNNQLSNLSQDIQRSQNTLFLLMNSCSY